MKKVLMILCILMISAGIYAQDNGTKAVPQTIISSFNQKYPGAEGLRWKTAKDEYQAIFKMGGKKYNAVYSNDGNWIKTEKRIYWTKNLPVPVRTSLKTGDFAAWYVDDIKCVETNNPMVYVVHVDNSYLLDEAHVGFKEEYKLYYSGDGSLIKKEKLD